MTGRSEQLRQSFLLTRKRWIFLSWIICLIAACLITGIFDQAVYGSSQQSDAEEGSFSVDIDDALSEFDLSDLEQFVSDNLSNTQMGFGELIRKLIRADEPLSFSQIATDLLSILF